MGLGSEVDAGEYRDDVACDMRVFLAQFFELFFEVIGEKSFHQRSFSCSAGEEILSVSRRSSITFNSPTDCSSELFWVRK